MHYYYMYDQINYNALLYMCDQTNVIIIIMHYYICMTRPMLVITFVVKYV
jgi:hypothetical protein